MLELLSPAGSMEALRAAVQNGANAVYLGCGSFNARQSARISPPRPWWRQSNIVISGGFRSIWR